MKLQREEVFNLFRSVLGSEAQSSISDRTIYEGIDKFSILDFGEDGDEKERAFWQTQAEYLKTSVKGNISAIAAREAKRAEEEALKKLKVTDDGKKDEELNAKLAEIETIKKSLEDKAKKENEDLLLIKQWKEAQDKEKAEKELALKISNRRKEITALCHKAENGMAYEPILEPLLEYFNFTDDKPNEMYLEEIKAKYNDMYSRQSKNGTIPLMGNQGSGASNIEDYATKVKKKREEEAKQKEEFKKKLINI